MIHIDRPDFHAMLAGAAHQLRWRIKAHGLAVQQRRGEGRRMVALEPGGNVDQQREAGGVRFGKPIFAEAADLRKDVLGELGGQALGLHAAQQLFAKLVDEPRAAPGAHGASQLVGFAGREARGHHGQDWQFNVSFGDGHASYIKIKGHGKVEGIAYLLNQNGYCQGSGNSSTCECILIRGLGWQADTLPARPLQTLKAPTGEVGAVAQGASGSAYQVVK